MEPAFDDGLSEDWISQPGSSDVSVLRDDSSFLSKSIRGSRIPLPKSQSTSSLPQRTSGRALVEKPASALNVGGSRSARVLSGKQQRERRTSVSSAEELGSVRRRSIQNGERGGDGAQHTTPEWKRRLLNSRGAASKQQGLFSSIGLENMFRPPTVRKEAVARPRGAKSSAPPTSVPPSSPPVLPNRDLQSISLSSPDESMQLPPVPMPPQNRMASMRQLSKARSRVVSGKSYLQHESFSPIQLASSLAMRKDEWPTLDGSSSASHHANGEQYRPTSSRSDSALELSGSQLLPRQQRPELDTTSISLPDDIEAETGCHPFVTMTRGGFSAEGSFQRRPLSPSSFQQQSMSAQNQSDTSKVLLSAPQTPRINTKARGGNDETRSSGSPNKRSPLKLFDKYDTFTNDRLSRRITQFEVRSNKSPTVDAPSEAEHRSSPSPVRTQPSLQSRTSSTQQRKTRMSSFGEGMLNQFNFTHEEKDHGLPRWPGREGLVVESDPAPLQRQTDTFESGVSESEGAYQNAQPSNRYPKGEVRGDIPLGEGKRLRSSPQKIPNAKRRRTINEEATEITGIQLQRQRPSISQNNSMAGKKRKDARYDNSDQTADPQIIATRHMLHPKARQHSGSRSSRQVSIARTAKTDETGEPFIDLEVATGVLAGELANLALNVAKDISQGERKKSVTTADFFHEANLIMQNLRLNATQNNNYENSPILESSRLQGIEESAAVFSTDNFSRPPSTEGSPLRRRVPGPKDFRIISRLRKFEDTDDIGLAINSSFQGLQKHEQAEGGTSDLDDSELSNIRILDPPRQKAPTGPAIRKKDGSIGTAKETESAKYPSSKSSSGRSVHTGSSGTGTKAVIPPDRVQHLIRNNMGRMTFDHEKNCWIKRKSSADQISAGDRLDSEVTEDDPFREIPDLDVDVSQELKTVLAVASRSGSLESSDKKQPAHSDSRPTLTRHEDIQQSFDRGTHLFTEKTQDVSNKSAGAGDESSEPVALETDRQRTAAAEDALMRGEVAEVSTPLEGNRRQARAVTVAFSSPLVQPAPVPSGNHDGEASDLELDADHLPEAQFDSAAPSQRRNRSILRSIKAVSKTASSSVRQFKASRALSRIDEGEKTSSPLQNAENTRSDLAVTLATPQVMVKKADGPLSILNSAKSYVPMQLTPLSDFTVHHADESLNLDVQYLAKRRGLASLQEIEGRFSLSIKDLVEKIADVEPYEPYWEHMRALRLQGRGLLTLHMLDDFCSRIEELDVSSNELGQLNGAPDTLRVLNAQKNCLSSLTAWGHLQNLQYVDISDNEIDSLAGFRELVHVRELKAEHNQIDSLDGVLHLNGLLKLKLKGNRVKAMDCRESDLRRLNELDLCENNVESIQGLEQLSSLQKLNLRNNRLLKIDFDLQDNYECLEFLDVSENELSQLDVTCLPVLRQLLLDSNRITEIVGLKDRFNTHCVSWRAQTLAHSEPEQSSSPLRVDCCSEVRTLSLAGTRLLSFSPAETFLSLERLDLASCGLDMLIKDLGTLIPNVRRLNLNYNAIKDIRPLLGIQRLAELHIAGNRIMRFRRTTEVICKIGQHVRILDCRSNPFTSGFYLAPHLERTSQKLVLKVPQEGPAEDSDPFNLAAYLVPDADSDIDEAYHRQLDFGTRIRRRVYELMLLKSSKQLEKLDGLQINGERILATDGVWERLVELEVVQLARD